MSILKKIKSTVESAAATVAPATEAVLSDRYAQAASALDAAQARFELAAHAAEIHPGDPAAIDALEAARRERDGAKQRADQVGAAITAQQTIERNRAAAEAAAERERRWDLAEEHAKARLRAAQDIEAAWSAIASASERLFELCGDMRTAAPVDLDSAATMAGAALAGTAVRLHGVKTGLPWAINWPWNPADLPTLTAAIEKANGELKRARAKAAAEG